MRNLKWRENCPSAGGWEGGRQGRPSSAGEAVLLCRCKEPGRGEERRGGGREGGREGGGGGGVRKERGLADCGGGLSRSAVPGAQRCFKGGEATGERTGEGGGSERERAREGRSRSGGGEETAV